MKSWLEKLNDTSRDVYERRYRLLSAVSITTMFLWLAVALIADGYSGRILFFLVCNLLFIPTMIITLRTGKIQVGAGASGIVLVFLMLPVAFFHNGGIYAGAPNWCIIAIVFVTLTVKGRLRVFLLVSAIVMTILCYVVTWLRPELVDEFTTASAYVDSLSSLIITGILTSVMFLFQLHMANQERRELERRQREILELNRGQNRFFSSMSHEIRTPVNTIIGLNEMILREDVSAEVAENATQVRDAGKMLLHLVNDILDMSKLESGRMELVCEPYSVGSMLSEIVGMLWYHINRKNLEFHVDIDPQLPSKLVGDEMRIKQILVNVLNNAVKYTEKGSITLSVQGRREERSSTCTVVFTISDTGTGIKKESLPHLFTAFRRVESEENRTIEGTGLGLSIVKQFVDLMGGTITVNSVYTRGSTFIIEIPQGETGAEPIGEFDLETRHSERAAQQYAHSFEAPDVRVLVVDDNAANRMVAQKLLRDTGMQIDTAVNGEEALQMTLLTAYDLILMDHLMPVMDGVTCLKLLRIQPGGLCRDARVIALTANADGESRRLYAQAGFDGYLVKPYSGEELEKECVRLLPGDRVRLIHADAEIVKESVLWMTEHEKREEIVVTTDSIADLPASVIRQYRIGIIPHIVHTAEGRFQDGREIEAAGLVDYMRRGDRLAETLPPDVAAYEAFFAQQLSRANQVVHISISSGIPGSGCEVAKEAARAFENVTVIDSGHLSSGEGLLVMEACRMIQEGLRPGDIVERLERMKDRVQTGFIVDSLDYMDRANLVRHRVAKIASTLMIRPVLKLKRGEIKIDRIYLGSREGAWRRYISRELSALSAIDRKILFVTYVGLSQKELGTIRDLIDSKGHFEKVYFQQASPAIAVNCGPGTFGLLYLDAR